MNKGEKIFTIHYSKIKTTCTGMMYCTKGQNSRIIRIIITVSLIILSINPVSLAEFIPAEIIPDEKSGCHLSVNRMPIWNLTPNQTEHLLSGMNKEILDLQILDSRPLNNYLIGHIAGAQWFWPETINPKSTSLNLNTSRMILIYTEENYPVEQVSTLELSGIPGVFVLEGGYFAWINEGKPVFTDSSQEENRLREYKPPEEHHVSA